MKTKRLFLALLALGTAAVKLAAQTPPVITTQSASQTVPSGGNALFSVTVSGTGPFTYQWRFNGTNLPNNIITTVAIQVGARSLASDTHGNLFIADRT